MSSIDGAVRRTSVVLGSTLGALLVVLLPSLLITGADGTSAIAVLAVACAAFVHFGTIALSLGSGSALAVPVRREAGIPPRPGRVTDPTHHPLRPRAPGTA